MQIGLLRVMCKVDFFERHYDTLSPDYFDGEVLQFIARVLLPWQSKYHADMPKEVLLQEIDKAMKSGHRTPIEEKVLEVVEAIYASRVPYTYIDAQYREWIRHQRHKRAILQAADYVKEGRYAESYRVIQDAYFSTDGYDLGHMFLTGSKERVDRRLTEREEKIPTLIYQLDDMLKGGAERKNVAIIMGEPKKGKSFLVTNIGKGAAALGFKVTHYTLEPGMPEKRVADRYDAAFSGIRMDALREAPEALIAAIEKAREDHGECLCIKEYPPRTCTVDTIRAHQKRLIAAGFHSDVIIVDYADVLKPAEHYDARWQEVSGIFDDLGKLASENNVVVWVISKARRLNVKRKVLQMQDVAESWDKMFAGDIIISLNQTEQERIEHTMRVNLIGARNIPSPLEIKVKTDFDHAQFAKPPAFDDEDEFVKREDFDG